MDIVQKQLDFGKQLSRGSFLEFTKTIQPNDQRFAIKDHDISHYLSKVRRVPGRDFSSYVNREPSIIQQAGDALSKDVLSENTKCAEFYSLENKAKFNL